MAEDPDKLLEMLAHAVAGLIEHFDAVQIVATNHGSTGTILLHAGKGNWYARRAAAEEWLEQEDEKARCIVRHQEEEK